MADSLALSCAEGEDDFAVECPSHRKMALNPPEATAAARACEEDAARILPIFGPISKHRAAVDVLGGKYVLSITGNNGACISFVRRSKPKA